MGVRLVPTRSLPVVMPAFLCKRPNLLRTLHRTSLPIQDTPVRVRVRVRVRVNLWEITLRSDWGAIRNTTTHQCC